MATRPGEERVGPPAGERARVVADASVLVNFMRAGHLDLVRHHQDYKVVVTDHLRREVALPDQATVLREALSAGDIDEISVTDPAEP